MSSSVRSVGLRGIDGFVVSVECALLAGASDFEIVGLPDAAVREAKERIRAALAESGFAMPAKEVVVNLAPADQRKEGTGFDLAIAVGLMLATGQLEADISDCCFIGELSLRGELRGTPGVISRCLAAREAGIGTVYVPAVNAGEAAVVEGVRVCAAADLHELCLYLNGTAECVPATYDMARFTGVPEDGHSIDFADVKGQLRAKRALEIAAAGGHNLLMIGPPGSGKSMLARRLPTILPPLTFDEAVETTKVYSAAGLLNSSLALVNSRPFRAPHHTMSPVSLAGGGVTPHPGEISLAHNGVLFLDELPEFTRVAAEVLRQPIEDGEITITRASGRCTFPSRFMLVCAMNPCRCGYYGHPTRECTCAAADRRKYLSRISGPLLDRIDIHVEVPALRFGELTGRVDDGTDDGEPRETSAQIRARVVAAREFMSRRTGGTIASNSVMKGAQIAESCRLTDESVAVLRRAYDTLNLSARGYDRLLRVSRTIADLAQSEEVEAEHIAEAVQLRTLDREYF